MSLARAPSLYRLLKLSPRRPPSRTLSTTPLPRPRFLHARRLATFGLASTALAGASLYAYKNVPVVHADSESREKTGHLSEPRTKNEPLSELLRAYIVYSLCSVPFLVDWSPTILSTLMAIPVLKQITEAVVRVTFFDQVSSL